MSCIQPNVSSFVNFRCVLCYKIPSTKCDINFFKEDVKTELEDVSVILAAVLKCICKLCLSLVEKRKGLREKLLELDANIRRIHKANFSSTNPRPAVAKGLEYEPKVNTNNVIVATPSKPTTLAPDTLLPIIECGKDTGTFKGTGFPIILNDIGLPRPVVAKGLDYEAKINTNNVIVATPSKPTTPVPDTSSPIIKSAKGTSKATGVPTLLENTVSPIKNVVSQATSEQPAIQEGSCKVTIQVHWPSKVRKKVLDSDLSSLGIQQVLPLKQ